MVGLTAFSISDLFSMLGMLFCELQPLIDNEFSFLFDASLRKIVFWFETVISIESEVLSNMSDNALPLCAFSDVGEYT